MNIARIFPHAAIVLYFYTIGFCSLWFFESEVLYTRWEYKIKVNFVWMWSSSGAQCTFMYDSSWIFKVWFEQYRVRLAMEKDNFTYKNNLNAFRLIFEKEGFFGFYRGYCASVIGIFIYHGFSFFIFTRLKE